MARDVTKQVSCLWIIIGTKRDAALADEIIEAAGPMHPRILNLTARTNLRELCAVLKLSRLLLTNDTGPMHLAAAVGTPVVALFGSTSPELTGPGLPADVERQVISIHAPCSPCFRRVCPIDFRCMKDISIEQVVDRVLKASR